jgi:hypothetical protein
MDAKEKKNLQVFGYGLAVIIAFFAIRLGIKHGFSNGKFIAIAIAVLLAVLTFLSLPTIKPFYRLWMKAAHFIGGIVNFVLLSLIFYMFFGAAGIILRILRKDILDERIDKSAKTYWKPSRSGTFDRERYTKQY